MPLGASRLNTLSYFVETAVTRTPVTITLQGDTQIDTAQSKYGGSSILFDGSGDYFTATDSNFAFGTGDFTIEGWFRITTGGNRGVFHLQNSYLPASVSGLAFAPRNDSFVGYIVYHGTNTSAIATTAPPTNTWIHFAIARNGNTMNIYVDGTRLKTRSDTFDYTYDDLAVGGYYSTAFLFNGHIDEFRMSTVARYTGASHTVPTAPFVNDADTVFLVHGDGTDGSTDITDDGGS